HRSLHPFPTRRSSDLGAIDPRKVSKPLVGHFDKAGVTPRRHLVEIRTSDVADYELGQDLTVEQFEAGQLIDVTANSKGKGFAGAMKRHNFGGAGASWHLRRRTTVNQVLLVAPPRQAAFSKVKNCPAVWAMSKLPPRTSLCTASMQRTTCCSLKVQYLVPVAALCWFAMQ